MRKRAEVPMTLITLAMIGVVVTGWFLLLKSGNLGNIQMIGRDQLLIIDTYTRAEEELASIDLAAYVAAQGAWYTLFTETQLPSECEYYGGYPQWSSAEGLCLPRTERLLSSYDEVLNDELFSLTLLRYGYNIRRDGDYFEIIGVPQGQKTYVIDGFGAGAR